MNTVEYSWHAEQISGTIIQHNGAEVCCFRFMGVNSDVHVSVQIFPRFIKLWSWKTFILEVLGVCDFEFVIEFLKLRLIAIACYYCRVSA